MATALHLMPTIDPELVNSWDNWDVVPALAVRLSTWLLACCVSGDIVHEPG